jgi:hypothetical protein
MVSAEIFPFAERAEKEEGEGVPNCFLGRAKRTSFLMGSVRQNGGIQ